VFHLTQFLLILGKPIPHLLKAMLLLEMGKLIKFGKPMLMEILLGEMMLIVAVPLLVSKYRLLVQ